MDKIMFLTFQAIGWTLMVGGLVTGSSSVQWMSVLVFAMLVFSDVYHLKHSEEEEHL